MIVLGFTLTSCKNDTDNVIDNSITNMAQLPIDLTKLESNVKSPEAKLVFLSTTVEPYIEEFEVSINDFTVNISDDVYLYDYTDERGAEIFKDTSGNSSLKSTEIDGGVQLLYTMTDSLSLREFSLELSLNDESSLVVDDNNQYYVVSSNGEIETFIGQPWAVDADGNFVDTHYVVEGNVIKQIIDYDGDNYPVQADPLFCTNTIDNGATTWDADRSTSGGSLMVVPTTCARIYLIVMYINPLHLSTSIALSVPLIADMYSETVNDHSYETYITYNESGILDQFVCHAYNPFTTLKSSWNLEPWRPNVSLWDTYTSSCNP